MIAELGNDDVCQQCRSGKTAFDRPRWRWRFDDAVAARAAELRPHMADHLEAVRNVLQLLGDVFAKLPQPPSAIRTAIASGNVRDDFTLKMFRKWLAFSSRLRFSGWRNAIQYRFHHGLSRLFLFKLKLQLFELENDLLALLTKHHLPQLLDHQLHVLDPLAACVEFLGLFRNNLAMRIEFGLKRAKLVLLSCQFVLMGADQCYQCVPIRACPDPAVERDP